MQFTQEFNIDTFSFHGPAVEVVKELRDLSRLEALEDLIEEMFSFSCLKRLPTSTEINDFVSYEKDFIFRTLGVTDDLEEDVA